MEQFFLSVVIPAYNEERCIKTTLSSIEQYLSNATYSYEILVVDDGSTDRTRIILECCKDKIPIFRSISLEKNRGKGYALRTGLLEANGRYRLFMDADHSTDIVHIEKVWPLIQKGFNVVVGTRSSLDFKGAKQIVPQNIFKRSIGKLGNVMIQLLILPGIWDTQCDFKVISADVCKRLIPLCQLDGWCFDVELLKLAKMHDYKIGMIPVQWVNHKSSKVTLTGYFDALQELCRLKIRFIKKD